MIFMELFLIISTVIATAVLLWLAYKERQYKKYAFAVAGAVPVLVGIIYFAFMHNNSQSDQSLVRLVSQSEQQVQAELLENYAKKEQDLKKELEAKPDDERLIYELAGSLMDQTKYDEAIAVLENALKKNPKSEALIEKRAVAYFAHGLFLAENGKYKQALDALKKAKVVTPPTLSFSSHIDLFIKNLEAKLNPDKAKAIMMDAYKTEYQPAIQEVLNKTKQEQDAAIKKMSGGK